MAKKHRASRWSKQWQIVSDERFRGHKGTMRHEVSSLTRLFLPATLINFFCNYSFLFETVKRAFQYWLDKSTIHIVPRWLFFGFSLALFFLRVYLVQGYFIVAYGLGIFLLNNFIAFLSPLEDPSEKGADGLSLPTSAKEGKEFRPFARRLPEFKFWLACTRGVLTCIVMTFFSVFDVPVFWPILLLYFFILFFMTMRKQIAHMYKHRYVPISFGKAKYKHAGEEKGMFGGGMSKGK